MTPLSALPPAGRWHLPDALKALAAQLIVLHHLAFYGPISEALAATSPQLSGWLADYARMAVQVFLVLGGFLATQALLRASLRWSDWPRWMAARYLRLVGPFAVAVILAVVVNALTRPWLDSDSVSAPVSLGQLLAHLSLLHSWLGVESLSAGVWYVAMDWQLHAVLALLMCLTRSRAVLAAALGGLILASLVYFNRDAAWDSGPLYFFGAYGMGAALALAKDTQQRRLCLALLTGAAGLALVLAWRERIVVSLSVAWLMAWGLHRRSTVSHPDRPGTRLVARINQLTALIAKGGPSSYALFLVHFPVILLVNAALQASGWALAQSGPATLAAGLFAWCASNVAAWGFHRGVERPLGRRVPSARSAPRPQAVLRPHAL